MLPVLGWYTSLPHTAAAASITTTTTTTTAITTVTTTTTTTNNNVFWGFEYSQHVLYVLRPRPGVEITFGKAG